MKRGSKSRKKHTIFRMFLIPLIAIMLIQSLFIVGTLMARKIFDKIQDYSVSMMSRIVENRRVILENEMIRCATAVSEQEDIFDDYLDAYLKKENITLEQMLSSDEKKAEYLSLVVPTCVDALQSCMSTGIFFVLTGEDMQPAAAYDGFFVRDSDPTVNTASNTDLLFERGKKELSRTFNIPLDTNWSTYFQMAGQAQDSSEEYFYEPWRAGMEHPDADIGSLGYWSRPFVLADSNYDAHEMITYSVPLRHEGQVYGVAGIELSSSLLYDYFPVSELNENEQSGYLLALQNEDGSYTALVGKGILYNSIMEHDRTIRMTDEEGDALFRVENVNFGTQGIYAISSPLKLYDNNAPYEDIEWVLLGLNEESELFGMSRQLYAVLAIALFLGLCFAVFGTYLIVLNLTKPIKDLMLCINGGSAGLEDFQASNILEIDALYDVVQDLTNRQKEAENILLEEKERYRIALESTSDIIFSYDFQTKLWDIVNHPLLSGTWSLGDQGFIGPNDIYYEDRTAVMNFFDEIEDKASIEFRIKFMGQLNYTWFGLSGKVVRDIDGNRLKLVGSLRNIQERKEQEAQQRAKMTLDGATGFYSYKAGIEELGESRAQEPNGVMIYLWLEQFRALNETNGIVFGNMVLEEIGRVIKDCCNRFMKQKNCRTIILRFNSDAFVLWFERRYRQQAEFFLSGLFHAFESLFDPETMPIQIYAGAVVSFDRKSSMELISMAKSAQTMVKEITSNHYCFYEDIPDVDDRPLPKVQGRQMVTYDSGEETSLASLALNLFGRGANLSAQMQLLLQKIGRQYGASDVLATILRPDFCSNYLEYQWHSRPVEPVEAVSRYTDQEWQEFQKWLGLVQIGSFTESDSRQAMLQKFLNIEPGQYGIVLPMYDSGNYMGNICIVGGDPALLRNVEERQKLVEVGSVIQSQINQQRHDLASKAKSDFLSRMSHEIRTPMNGIIGMTTIALKNEQDKDKMLDCLNKIQDSSKYLLVLINDILDMSKIESGKMHLYVDDFDIHEMLDGVASLILMQAQAKEIEFVQEIDLTHGWFVGDQLRIRQVLVNLLGNAVKFTGKNGRITLTVQEKSHGDEIPTVYFAVQDSGIGISKENQERVFRAFEQAQEANAVSGQQGTGLGLSISSRLIQMMGSTIKLESELGKGSCFSFEIPLPPGQEEKTVEEEEKVSFENFRVLIVEDNQLNMEIARYLLEDYGFIVDEAYDGAQAVERIKTTEPGTYDLILMDIMMPVMDGLEATRTIRGLDREDCKTLPIIAMSANAFDDDLRKSVECGMNGHLSKPVEVDKLYQMLKEILL